MKKICIILIRSGSKRLPDKNIKELGGQPLCFWTIDVAIESGIFDEIWIASDSDYYLSLCKNKYGCSCNYLKRSMLTSKDDSSTYDSLSELFFKSGYDDFIFMNLQVTSPFRLVSHLQESMDLFESSGLENLVSFVDHPFKKDLYMKVKGNQLCCSEVCDNNLDHTYYPNGSIWISRKNIYLKNKTFYTDKTFVYLMSRFYSIDIDDEYDFKVAELFSSDMINDRK